MYTIKWILRVLLRIIPQLNVFSIELMKRLFLTNGYMTGTTSMSPNSNRLVFPSAAHFLSVRTPVHGEYLIAMAWKVDGELSCPDVPHLQCSVFR